MASHLTSIEGTRNYQDLMSYEWTDYEDYVQKYGSLYNPEANVKRQVMYNRYNNVGAMLRKGIVEREDIYDHIASTGLIQFWAKYRPIVEEGRKRLNGKDWLMDFEYLADEMLKEKLERDPSYKVPETFGVRLPEK
jgi:hypothetical protein